MLSGLKICPHCRRDFNIRISDNIGFRFYWKGDYFLFEIVLFVEDYRGWFILYREVYGV